MLCYLFLMLDYAACRRQLMLCQHTIHTIGMKARESELCNLTESKI
jgi:hypothetical protein